MDTFILIISIPLIAATRGLFHLTHVFSDENNTHYISRENSDYVGKTYVTKIPLLYKKNLPKNDCYNRECVFRTEVKLAGMVNRCPSCLNEDEFNSNYRLQFLQAGTELSVIDAFSISSKSMSLGGGGSGLHLIVKDQNGLVSEVPGYLFDSLILTGDYEKPEADLISNIAKLSNNEKLEFKYCIDSGYEKILKTKQHYLSTSRYIEIRVMKFINDFKLNNQIDISEIGWKDIDGGSRYTCALLVFNTLDAYLLSDYYFYNWNLPTQKFLKSELHTPKAFKAFNYNQFKKLSTDQLLKYKRE